MRERANQWTRYGGKHDTDKPRSKVRGAGRDRGEGQGHLLWMSITLAARPAIAKLHRHQPVLSWRRCRKGRAVARLSCTRLDIISNMVKGPLPPLASKRIAVFANSIKKGARCVAGVEVGKGGALVPARWIRPVSGESEGELEPRHMRLEGGGSVSVLDIVDVPLNRYAGDAVHPEDWLVDTSRNWTRTGVFESTMLQSMEEKPNDLWLEPDQRPDRVTGAYALKRSMHQSLYLVRPGNFRVELSVRQYPDNPNPSTKRRALFFYRGIEYGMNLTDPVFTDAYCSKLPAIGEPAVTIRPRCGDRCLVCVSLTPLFRDFHWKVVATVLELP